MATKGTVSPNRTGEAEIVVPRARYGVRSAFAIRHLPCVILIVILLLAGCATRPTFRTVVVDPGHGGHDPGATQRGVLPEKVWTLDLANRLKNRLEQGGFNVVLTRQSDVFIPLEERVQISNTQHDAIFVSLHFNSLRKRDIQGIETYYDTWRSAKLANAVQKSVLLLPGIFDRRVKTAPYFVIRRNAYPAILIEGGFLSNPVESRRIASPVYRDALAEQIYQGIIAYRGGPPSSEH